MSTHELYSCCVLSRSFFAKTSYIASAAVLTILSAYLNMSKEEYAPIMRKVFEVAKFIEKNFGNKPQDIEGGIILKENPETGELEPEIHIWQTRDEHLIER